MLKHAFFLKAIAAQAHTKRQWVISILAVVREDAAERQETPFPYRVVQSTTGFYFIDPENNNELTPIEDAVVGQPLFHPMDGIDITRDLIINAPPGKTRVSIGNVLFNEICITPAFGRKFAFRMGLVSVAEIEQQIAFLMRDDPIADPKNTGYREGNDDTFTHDGVEYHINTVFENVERLGMKPQSFSTKALEWAIKDNTPDPVRLEKANPNVPILVAKVGNQIAPVDGLHRVTKALNEGRPTIQGYMVDQAILDKSRNDQVIWVSEYLKFVNSFSYLTEFNQIVTQALTAKAITAPPGIKEFKAALFEKYKDMLHDPTTIAIIEGELEKFDAAYLKGDPSERFLISDKSRKVVRKKLFLMYGAEAGLSGGRNMELVKQSLEEGWEPDKLPAMNNASRAGSYFRGFETQKGGEEVKWLFRASSNIQVLEQSCGSTLGKAWSVDERNVKKLVGLNLITTNGIQMIDNEPMAQSLMGKNVLVRSPMYCKHKFTDYCKDCMGKKLSANKDAVSMAIAAEGSAFMLLSMGAMHGKSLSLAKMDLSKSFS